MLQGRYGEGTHPRWPVIPPAFAKLWHLRSVMNVCMCQIDGLCCITLLLFRYMVFGNVMSGLEVLKSLEQFGDWTGTVKVCAETIPVGIMPLRVACIQWSRSAAAFIKL